MRGLSGVLYIADEFGNTYPISRKREVTDNDILCSGVIIANVCKCYPPNIIDTCGKRVFFYSGLEEGLMGWDSIDKRKLKKEIKRYFNRRV